VKLLYAIQGTGNGHIARAREIIPFLQKQHEVDILISGTQSDIDLPFAVTYRFKGLSFVFGKKGGVDIYKTYKKGNLRELFREVNALDVQQYDLVLNDFEPVSAWACRLNHTACISVSHQAAVLNKNAPQPKRTDYFGKAVLKKYAPTTSQYGFHFQAYDKNIFTPVIRKEIRDCMIENQGHYTVYLPAYDDERILSVLKECGSTSWEVFSKHNKKTIREKNIVIRPIENDAFIKSMASAEGVLCGAGFETPAEALYLGKKLMVIPMKTQFEQQCNAAALKKMGVPVIKSLKKKNIDKIRTWLQSAQSIPVDYPDNTESILKDIIFSHSPLKVGSLSGKSKQISNLKNFREENLKEILKKIEA
jgi:uncharacterized protein (TIGR00661 family)